MPIKCLLNFSKLVQDNQNSLLCMNNNGDDTDMFIRTMCRRSLQIKHKHSAALNIIICANQRNNISISLSLEFIVIYKLHEITSTNRMWKEAVMQMNMFQN